MVSLRKLRAHPDDADAKALLMRCQHRAHAHDVVEMNQLSGRAERGERALDFCINCSIDSGASGALSSPLLQTAPYSTTAAAAR
jgi:hypothetical protein